MHFYSKYLILSCLQHNKMGITPYYNYQIIDYVENHK